MSRLGRYLHRNTHRQAIPLLPVLNRRPLPLLTLDNCPSDAIIRTSARPVHSKTSQSRHFESRKERAGEAVRNAN